MSVCARDFFSRNYRHARLNVVAYREHSDISCPKSDADHGIKISVFPGVDVVDVRTEVNEGTYDYTSPKRLSGEKQLKRSASTVNPGMIVLDVTIAKQ